MKEFEAPICKKCGKPFDIIRKPIPENYLNVDWDYEGHVCKKKIKIKVKPKKK